MAPVEVRLRERPVQAKAAVNDREASGAQTGNTRAMRTFWTNTPGWRLLRAVVLGLVVFAALVWLLAPWLAALLAIIAAALSIIDAARAGRAGRARDSHQP